MEGLELMVGGTMTLDVDALDKDLDRVFKQSYSAAGEDNHSPLPKLKLPFIGKTKQ